MGPFGRTRPRPRPRASQSVIVIDGLLWMDGREGKMKLAYGSRMLQSTSVRMLAMSRLFRFHSSDLFASERGNRAIQVGFSSPRDIAIGRLNLKAKRHQGLSRRGATDVFEPNLTW